MTTPNPPPADDKPTLAPTRSYHIPGGPYASDLNTQAVKPTAEFERGSDQDRGYGGKR